MWGKIIYQFSNFNCAAYDVWDGKVTSSHTLLGMWLFISMFGLKSIHVSERGPWHFLSLNPRIMVNDISLLMRLFLYFRETRLSLISTIMIYMCIAIRWCKCTNQIIEFDMIQDSKMYRHQAYKSMERYKKWKSSWWIQVWGPLRPYVLWRHCRGHHKILERAGAS